MAKTVLLRIDDRLLHGQIGRAWYPGVEADIIVVANDEVHDHEDQQKLMDLVTPIGGKTHFLTVDETGSDLDHMEAGKNAIVLVASPADALKLIKAGISVNSVNLGNMRKLPGKKEVNADVYLSEEDIQDLREIEELGHKIDIRTVPTDKPTDLNKIFG